MHHHLLSSMDDLHLHIIFNSVIVQCEMVIQEIISIVTINYEYQNLPVGVIARTRVIP